MFKSLTSDLDEITVAVGGGVNLQLVFGDITNENTDAVVNTTDFLDFQKAGVCRDILTLAGLQVETELRSARVAQGEVLVTQPGQFPCQAILHVCGQRDATVIQGLVGDIIKKCEVKRLTCVAIPAICAGEGGLKPDVVAGAILQGVKAITSTPLHCLSLIRVVLNKIEVFQAFEVMTQKLFPSGAVNTASPPASLNAAQSLQSQPPSPSASALDLSSLLYTFSSSEMPSEFLILGLSDKDVARAAADLLRLYQANCSQHSFTPEELASLSQEEVDELGKLREDLGLCVEQNQGHGGPGGQDTQGGWTVRGPKDSVNQVVQVIQRSIQGSLLRKVKDKEEDVVHAQVAWCILGTRGAWERFPKKANYTLEKRDTAAGVVDSQGDLWNVDLSQMEATRHATRQVAKLKRLENLPDFLLPLYWDNMATGENVKLVTLLPATEEYRRLKADFKRTATMTVLKIERVQNVHLKRAYEVRKKHVADKRGNYPGLGEKALYHGTSHDNSQSIIETGFDWRFSGQNATMYGMGNYFAVNASYSANPTYSRPGPDGSRLMFVARVLTGAYTQGDSTMKVPPARSPQQPNDRYDSVVNDVQSPTMFVVFNDSAAYPDYLITFK
ncbi:protein mono-ADP-ribosyltransferase PARP14-like [Aplochiton taeniatus]